MVTTVEIGVGEGNSSSGSGTLSELYPIFKRLLLKSQDGFGKLERFEYTSSSSLQSSSSSSSVAMADPSKQSFDAESKAVMWAGPSQPGTDPFELTELWVELGTGWGLSGPGRAKLNSKKIKNNPNLAHLTQPGQTHLNPIKPG
ncbi:hypothetical protein FXO37_23741 [Capsicum annuum]|nr:hypothetical protein FXO37_23741 [Capsicum annuum]